jgi:lipoprotein-anchoring transpeptidase ErfK/SrfK
VVQRGENLYRIALRYGTTVQALASANNLSTTSLIRVGQTLVIPGGESTSAAPSSSPVSAPTSGKWIDINLATQGLVAYEGQQPVYWATVSTGLARTPTPKGRFRIYSKYRSTAMSGPGYRYTNVPYVMFFYSGYSLHGCYWHNNFGQPMSHGCVNMRTGDAQWLYNWAPVGTLVVIH